jgi:hypothetical protein
LDEQHYTFEIFITSVSGQKMTSAFALANHDGSIISSNFAMETGETVVIGTSGLKGNRALVVLLTAVPRANAITQTKKGSGK